MSINIQHRRHVWGVVAVIGAVSACTPDAEVAAIDVQPVLVTTVQPQAQAESRTLSATVQARDESNVAFRAAGKVVERLVDVGAQVTQGQPLARLDANDYQLGVSAATDQWRAAEIDATQQRLDAERLARLVADGSAGRADLERQKARAAAAQAQQAQALRQLELAKNRATYTTVLAPFSGVITRVNVEAGQVVAEGQPVFGLAKQGAWDVVADIPEQLVADLSRWQAHVSLWQDPRTVASVQLRELSPVAHPQTRTYSARFSPAPAGWRLGMTAQLTLQGKAQAPVVRLPASSLMQTGDQPFVWRMEGNTAHVEKALVTVVSYQQDAILVDGLVAGDRIVTVGAQKIDPNMTLRPIERPLSVDTSAATAQTVSPPQGAAQP
jgi:RND family efflux transporter MFP subunit